MSVATFNPATPLEVVEAIHQFLSDAGWTINLFSNSVFTYGAYAPSAGKRLHASLAGFTVSLFGYQGTGQPFPGLSMTDPVALSAGTGFDGTKNWDAMPGACRTASGQGLGPCIHSATSGGTLRLYSWDGQPNIAAVLEQAGIFTWLCWGRLQPFGSLSGGEYITASHEPADSRYLSTRRYGPFMQGFDDESTERANRGGFVRSDLGGEYPGEWFFPTKLGAGRRVRWPLGDPDHRPALFESTGTIFTRAENARDQVYLNGLLAALPSGLLGVSPLLPLPVFGENGYRTGLYMPLGSVPHMRYVDMGNIEPGKEIVLGSDTWVCWPIAARSETDRRGLAIRVEV